MLSPFGLAIVGLRREKMVVLSHLKIYASKYTYLEGQHKRNLCATYLFTTLFTKYFSKSVRILASVLICFRTQKASWPQLPVSAAVRLYRQC